MPVVDQTHRGLPKGQPFGAPPYDVRGVTLHYTAGGLGAGGVINTLLDRNLAYHYIVERDGTIHELVKPTHRVAHAGSYRDPVTKQVRYTRLPQPPGGYPNRNTIAVSFDNAGYNEWPRHRAAIPSWTVAADPRTGQRRRWQPYTREQLDAGVSLVARLLEQHGLDENRIYTHSQLSPNKSDPGPAFPLYRFKRNVGVRLRGAPLLLSLAPVSAPALSTQSVALLGLTALLLGGTAVMLYDRNMRSPVRVALA
jgi:N-acetyl-anhydromuramyl-L-alanine amidase AmpD